MRKWYDAVMREEEGPFGGKEYLLQVEAGVRWWESMRVWYNVAVILSGLFVVFFTQGIFMLFTPVIWVEGALYLLMANVAYLMGPGLDVYVGVLWKGRFDMERLRGWLWLSGMMFACGLTLGLGLLLG